jgi:hypothetical protein
MNRRTLMALAVALCAAAPAEGQIQVDTVDVTVAEPVVRVVILPTNQRISLGDTITFSMHGLSQSGDTIPISGRWVVRDPDVLQLLGPTEGPTVRAVAVSRGNTRVTVDETSIIRLDLTAINVGMLPTNIASSADWNDLDWSHARTLTAVGDSVVMCAYAYVGPDIAYGSGSHCPSPPSQFGIRHRPFFEDYWGRRVAAIIQRNTNEG